MQFYHITDAYVSYLSGYDSKVEQNKNQKRPYIGVVVQIGGINYYAPFTSPKKKHLKMKNAKDFRKIGGGAYGAINFNNMIPVPDTELIPIYIWKETDPFYRNLLQNQYDAVLEDKEAIIETAVNLRVLEGTDDEDLTPQDIKVKQRCCDFALLEAKCADYTKN